ncbi:MAG: hypothetical protein M3178_04330 [Pseudomonadota bacterium]|nr:hypothetical protein [Pseudomonadota bacterium]
MLEKSLAQQTQCVFSASLDRRSEDVRVLPIIVTELEFGNIERHIFPAHFVECADHAALEDRPEAFDCLSMDRSNDVLTSRMVNSRVGVFAFKALVAAPLISAKQADFVGDGFADERGERSGSHVRNYPRDDIPFPANRADDWRLAGTNAARSAPAPALIPMPIFGQAADESFIDFDNAAELPNIFHQGNTDTVAHIPSRFKGAEAHISPNLPSAHSLLASEHKMDDAEPIAKRFIGVLKNRSGDDRKPVTGRSALRALPVPFAGFEVIDLGIATTWAVDAIRPPASFQIGLACVFVREHRLELGDAHLMNLRGLFCASHSVSFLIVKGHWHIYALMSSAGTSPKLGHYPKSGQGTNVEINSESGFGFISFGAHAGF